MISGPLLKELLKEAQELRAYVIMMNRHADGSWYYHKLRENPSITGVIWTPYLKKAHLFIDEESVEEFKMKFIAPRTVQILRIDREAFNAA